MKTPAFWQTDNALSTLLLPLSKLYALGLETQKKRQSQPVTLPVPVICVGNATAGGAGKTPVALAIGERLKAKNINAYFLSRGYGGKMPGPTLVNPEQHSAQDVGDEPLLLARLLPTVVAKDRLAGAQFAITHGAKIIIMDDGLQNHSIAKTLALLVVDGRYGFGNRRLLPAGPLREPLLDIFARAHTAIVIGNGEPSLPNTLPTLTAHLTPSDTATSLRGKNVFAFCGIAHPEKFFDTLALLGAHIVGAATFADHRLYNERDLAALAARAKTTEAVLVTTAKDAARLSPKWKSRVTVVEVTLTFDHPEQLDTLLNSL